MGATVREKVARLQIRREAGWLYYLRDAEAWRPATAGLGARRRPPERVAVGEFAREPGWLYFLDDEGSTARRCGGRA